MFRGKDSSVCYTKCILNPVKIKHQGMHLFAILKHSQSMQDHLQGTATSVLIKNISDKEMSECVRISYYCFGSYAKIYSKMCTNKKYAFQD